ncbi:MAG: CotH kinase family protein [Oscillospiraceae bacterium]|nr:CotH kinase family protein [Oscillospiraceae bacterium]
MKLKKILITLLNLCAVLIFTTACEASDSPDEQSGESAQYAQSAEPIYSPEPARPTEVEDLGVPTFSHEPGFFSEEFYLTLSGAEAGQDIRFTLDGSEPILSSAIFTEPILIYSPEAIMENSPMTQGSRPIPLPRPYYNGMVVRARIFDGEIASTEIDTRSFFVETEVDGRRRGTFNMRVISAALEPTDFVTETGMYQNYNTDIRRMAHVEVFYPDGELLHAQHAEMRVAGNWSRRERLKSVRFNFGRGDGVADNADLIPQTRRGFYNPLEHVSRFRQVNLRTSDLHQTTIREALTDLITAPLRPENQNATPAVLFVNGEFWGIYCFREQRNRTFIAEHNYGISEDSVVMVEFAWNQRNTGDHTNCTAPGCGPNRPDVMPIYPLDDCFEGIFDFDGPFGPWLDENGRLPREHPLSRIDFEEGPDESAAYRSWMRMYNAIVGGRVYCDSCMEAPIMPAQCGDCLYGLDMSNQADFDIAMQFVCFDNLIDHFLIYFHLDNWDWPGNNFILWKTAEIYDDVPTGDGLWRFVTHDFDNAFGDPAGNGMELFTTPGTGFTAGVPDTTPLDRVPYYHDNQPIWAVAIWYSLFQNEHFRNTVAARYATYAGTVFHPLRVNHLIDGLIMERIADIGSNIYRWNMHGGDFVTGVTNWMNSTHHLRVFAAGRAGHALEHIRSYYNRTDRPNLGHDIPILRTTIFWTMDSNQGFFNISGAEIRPELFDRDGAPTFNIDNFHAAYLRGLPIEVTVHPFEGHTFSHFEVTGTIEKRVHDISMIIIPPDQEGIITVTAVFE